MPVRMRMRWTAYAGTSAALAAGVVLKALAQRPNFYSAAVYLSQSSANLMILTNLLFVIACTFLLGLQKLLYGNLRPIEVEQLYEKAWFAVTETCLAMTVFRGEIGLSFLAMFFALLTGKIWGWIGEGRVEVLEQQPPRNPRLFHTRLALSLGLSVAFDLTMLEYIVKQVMRMARPDMMVMFGFEFAVLSIMSISTAVRYAINVIEIGIVREQKRQRIEQIKKDRLQSAVSEFQQSQAPQAAPTDPAAAVTPTPTQLTLEQVTREALSQPVDENEVEVEGWEDKGRYMFYLNLITDFYKLLIYLAFFFILLVFYGLPIHILRDVFLTMRSFLKRISDFVKYRTATRDMNARYPDATAEEIGREDVCIICREEMHPYQAPAAQEGQRPNPVAERMRPKKLPCGHILHFSCLRSWLERQQICPTCRSSVVSTNQAGGTGAGQGGAPQPNGGQAQPHDRAVPRVYQFGPLRIGVGVMRGFPAMQDIQQQVADAGAIPQPPANGNRNANADPTAQRQVGVGIRLPTRRRRQSGNSRSTEARIDELEQQVFREAEQLAQNSAELSVLRLMQAELARLRAMRRPTTERNNANNSNRTVPRSPDLQRAVRLDPGSEDDMIAAGSDRLPPGLTLPEGWSMMPLHPTVEVGLGGRPAAPGVFAARPNPPNPANMPPVEQLPQQYRGIFPPSAWQIFPGLQALDQAGTPQTNARQEEASNQYANGGQGNDYEQEHPQQNPVQTPQQAGVTPFGTASGLNLPTWGSFAPPQQQTPLNAQTEIRNGSNTENTVAADSQHSSVFPSQPLPSWGFNTGVNGDESTGSTTAQMNGGQNESENTAEAEAEAEASASSSSSAPTDSRSKHATVEDSVQDSD
ncbi:E3 ubiquitin-protein ligase hrd1 [Knufia peltigerae]|uniref:RING-type E3 ubiquitin transferase n=1 Tax=Knufia peltigerae TaxID=1002370 RepID=A0AA38Y2H0_9EURO|nr:E3 ubiquitin-protein ligase hrd1 [Knufia peltigerae]